MTNPRETNEEEELQRKIQLKIDDVVKECLEWSRGYYIQLALATLLPRHQP